MIKILGFPTRHPYTAKFHQKGLIEYVNPETDYFNGSGGHATPEFIRDIHSPNSYDLVHIHFSFDKLESVSLRALLEYFKSNRKPIVWTCHSRESQRERGIGSGKLQRMLYDYANMLISPTNGCREWLTDTYGKSKSVEVIPLGYMADPNKVVLNAFSLSLKKKTNFIYLIGDMRQNKEINLSIERFLKSPELSDCTLTVIVKPIENHQNLDERRRRFLETIHSSPQIKVISQPEVSNDLLTELFCKHHVCMLPYLWGTHSGQVELAKDCGCYSVISNVGFYKEQVNEVVDFEYDDNLSIFASNLVKALIQAKNMDFLVPQPKSRKTEMELITQKHTEIYKKLLKN